MARSKEKWGFWFTLCIAILYPGNSVLRRTDKKGWDTLPPPGTGLILAVNHISVVDPLIICREVFDSGRLPYYLAKESIFRVPVAGSIMRGAKQIPVSRGTADAARALDAAVEALQAGRCVIIYPEGTTSRDPDLWPMEARTGVARLALLSGAPVIPVAQWGAHRLYRRGGKPHLFRRPTVSTRVGSPLDLSAYAADESSPTVLREITDRIMGEITRMLATIRTGETPPEKVTVWRRGETEPTPVDLESVDKPRDKARAKQARRADEAA